MTSFAWFLSTKLQAIPVSVLPDSKGRRFHTDEVPSGRLQIDDDPGISNGGAVRERMQPLGMQEHVCLSRHVK